MHDSIFGRLRRTVEKRPRLGLQRGDVLARGAFIGGGHFFKPDHGARAAFDLPHCFGVGFCGGADLRFVH